MLRLSSRPPQNTATVVLSCTGTPWAWAAPGQHRLPRACGPRARSPSSPWGPWGCPWGSPPCRERGGARCPLHYPVFVLADLLHLKPLGTLALGHLPGDLHRREPGKKLGFWCLPSTGEAFIWIKRRPKRQQFPHNGDTRMRFFGSTPARSFLSSLSPTPLPPLS